MTLVGRPYEESYPASLLGLPGGGPATGATAGIPGVWTPAGSTPPASQLDAMQGRPYTIKATPATAWTTGQYVQTQTAGAAGRVTWTGTAWVGGVASDEAGRQVEVEPPEAQYGADSSSPPAPDAPPAPAAGGGGVELTDDPPAEPQRRRRSRP
jgi:hypothetical protein